MAKKYDSSTDYYGVLRVPPTATKAEIEKARRMRARLHHPDGHRAPELAAEEMRLINEAARVLTDEALRREYNDERCRAFFAEYREDVLKLMMGMYQHGVAQVERAPSRRRGNAWRRGRWSV